MIVGKEYYKPGDWWLLCDQCQGKMRYSESTKRWDGLIVHKEPNRGCYETRHPQEFVRPIRDMFPLPVVRPDNDGIDRPFTVHSLIEDADWAVIPSGTFEGADYDFILSDELFSDVVALLHLDDFQDEKGHSFTSSGGVTIDEASYQHGEASAQFDGSNYLTAANSADWDFGTGNFTIEGWVKL